MLDKESYLQTAKRLVKEHRLPVKILDCKEVEGKLTFLLTTPKKVDLRRLTHDLSRHFNQEVNLIPIGQREKAALIGGIGPCGRPLCCRLWLGGTPAFAKASAGRQIHTDKSLRGMCGKLACCLLYELPGFKCPRVGVSEKEREPTSNAPARLASLLEAGGQPPMPKAKPKPRKRVRRLKL